MQYDETEAIAFIRKYIPSQISAKYTDDEILNIIDMIWDYYEDNGFLELSTDDDENDEEPQLHNILAYVKKMLAKDKLAVVDIDDAHYIVEGELAYEESLEVEEE